ncbi:MAG: hypothetical protein S4CHLAM20_15450 [Chlamydiia bacterium]|nr:hypothetical protein [Chlamydiia bacterium]
MNSLILLYIFKNFVTFSIFGCSTVYGVKTFSNATNENIQILSKRNLTLVSIIFYMSIFVFYKNTYFSTALSIFIGEIFFSVYLGILWTWLFLVGAKSIGKQLEKPKYVKLWAFFSVLAFTIYCISR